MKKTTLILSTIVCLITIASLTQCENPESNIQPLTKSWEIAIPNQEIPEGLVSLKSKDCGVCHQKHYEEWKFSTHSHAWTDLQFQAELKKESSPFMCINCHIPLQNQQEFLIKGLIDGDIYQPVKEKNPLFDIELQQEGINCASCHVRNGAIIGPTGTAKAPHKTIKDTQHLSENLCISCHNATAVITPTLACSFETGDEWKAGPYFEEKNCKSCHMEEVEREIVAGYGKRTSHYHFFAGSGIPKFDTVTTKILNGMTFFPSKVKDNYSLTDSIIFSLKVKNELAGHKIPTGDPERFFLIQLTVLNEQKDTVISKTERIGEHWEWYPEAKKIADNNLLPKEERTYTIGFLPTQKERLILHVQVTKNRMNKATAVYNKLGDNYPLFITVFNEKHEFSIK